MIVHIVVPFHRHSLSPDKIAAHMNEMLDPDNDHVTSVTVCNDKGRVEAWSVDNDVQVFEP